MSTDYGLPAHRDDPIQHLEDLEQSLENEDWWNNNYLGKTLGFASSLGKAIGSSCSRRIKKSGDAQAKLKEAALLAARFSSGRSKGLTASESMKKSLEGSCRCAAEKAGILPSAEVKSYAEVRAEIQKIRSDLQKEKLGVQACLEILKRGDLGHRAKIDRFCAKASSLGLSLNFLLTKMTAKEKSSLEACFIEAMKGKRKPSRSSREFLKRGGIEPPKREPSPEPTPEPSKVGQRVVAAVVERVQDRGGSSSMRSVSTVTDGDDKAPLAGSKRKAEERSTTSVDRELLARPKQKSRNRRARNKRKKKEEAAAFTGAGVGSVGGAKKTRKKTPVVDEAPVQSEAELLTELREFEGLGASEILEKLKEKPALAKKLYDVLLPGGGTTKRVQLGQIRDPALRKVLITLFRNYISAAPDGTWRTKADKHNFGFNKVSKLAETEGESVATRPHVKETVITVRRALDAAMADEEIDPEEMKRYSAQLLGVALAGSYFKKGGSDDSPGEVVVTVNKGLLRHPRDHGPRVRPIGHILLNKLEEQLKGQLPDGVKLKIVKSVAEQSYYDAYDFLSEELSEAIADGDPPVHRAVLARHRGVLSRGGKVNPEEFKRFCVEHTLFLSAGGTFRFFPMGIMENTHSHHEMIVKSWGEEGRHVKLWRPCHHCQKNAPILGFMHDLKKLGKA